VLDGWVANLGERKLHIISADLQSWAPRSSIGIKTRHDVSEHLRTNNSASILTDKHGFTTVFPGLRGQTISLYLVETTKAGETATFYGPIDAAIVDDEALALQLVESAYGEPWGADPAVLERCFRPLFQTQGLERQAVKFEYGPKLETLNRPLTSVIVPIFADPFWVNCVFHLQHVLDPSFEIIVVNDDPRIAAHVQKMLENRGAGTKIRTVLVQNARNYGFGTANNIGVAAASGDVLILMNSDIFVADASALVAATDAIRADQNLLIGFLLLYEDDTIQHIGMDFRRSTEMGNLYIVDHPEKGLPSAGLEDEVREVPAVTGALMALARRLYDELNGFDPIYIKGDFEDADLCLRAKELGARVELHIKKGLHHLERQSIAQLGSDKTRRLITYLNCVEFNRRWAAKLETKKELTRPASRVFKVKPRTRSAAKLTVAG
jgi:GT2 family glycosyltransferase